MAGFKGYSIDDIIARGSIGDSDVMKLRSVTYADGRISAAEADELFRLNSSGIPFARSWNDYFIEAITDFLVNQVEPLGYVTAENAQWLIERISADGHVNTRTELELAITVTDRARWSPESLVRFTLGHVRDAVLTGTGVLRNGSALSPGMIGDAEVELLRRILYAFGGDGSVAISRTEAEMLFDINDSLVDESRSPTWTDLFVKAIANAVMAASSYAVPTREEALRREAWLGSHTDLTPLGLVKSLMSSDGSLISGYRALSSEERALDRLERQRIELVVNERVTEGEAGWLAERIGRNGKVSENEKALLAFLSAESPDIHPILKDLVARHVPAA